MLILANFTNILANTFLIETLNSVSSSLIQYIFVILYLLLFKNLTP